LVSHDVGDLSALVY